MKKGTSSDGWKNTGEEAGDTKLAQICLPPRSINFPSLESEGRDSTSHPFFKVHNLHFPPPNPRGPLIRRASEQQLFFPYSHSRGAQKTLLCYHRKAICASLPVCVRSLSLAAAACTGTLQLGITRLQCGNRLRGSNDCCLRRAKWSPPPPARLTYETNLFTLSHGIYLTICV